MGFYELLEDLLNDGNFEFKSALFMLINLLKQLLFYLKLHPMGSTI